MRTRIRWQGIVVLTVALVAMWAFAPVGMAKGKPTNPGGGGGKGPALAVEVVDFAGSPMSSIVETTADAPFGDRVAFRVSLDGEPVVGLVTVALASGTYDFTTDHTGTTPLYAAKGADIASATFGGIVAYEGSEVGFTLDAGSYDDCFPEMPPQGDENGFFVYRTGPGVYEANFPELTLCRWHPATPGVWRVSLAVPNGTRATASVFMSLKDHLPGNWCSKDASLDAPDYAGAAGIRGRIRQGELALLPNGQSLEVYTPASGICLRGGAGGDTLGAGDPNTFVVTVEGRLTLEWIGATP